MDTKLVPNQFAVDYSAGNSVIDINNPPAKRYVHQNYPRMLYPETYPAAKAVVVQNEKEEASYLKRKYTLKPPVKKAEESEVA